MIKIPFSRAAKDEKGDKASVTFSDYCWEEIERRHDRGADFDKERFKAAVDLVVGRLRAMEEKEGKP